MCVFVCLCVHAHINRQCIYIPLKCFAQRADKVFWAEETERWRRAGRKGVYVHLRYMMDEQRNERKHSRESMINKNMQAKHAFASIP